MQGLSTVIAASVLRWHQHFTTVRFVTFVTFVPKSHTKYMGVSEPIHRALRQPPLAVAHSARGLWLEQSKIKAEKYKDKDSI